MTTPLAKKIDGKKFMWDCITYENEEQARENLAKYEKDGFEARILENDGHYLVYSRRIAAVQASE